MRLTSHYHSFLQSIDLQEIESKIISVQTQLQDIKPDLNNKTSNLFKPHLEYLTDKLQSTFDQLQTFRIKRTKRGLIDGLGSVIKSLTGNLDYTDAQRYNDAIKVLQEDENKLITEFNSHISLTKDWTVQYETIINSISENQSKIESLLNKIRDSDITRDTDLIKYAHLAQAFLVLTDNVESVFQEIYKLEDALAFIKVKSMPHSILTLDSIKAILSRLVSLYNKESVLELDAREYYDVVKIGFFYADNRIVIVYKFPILKPQNYNLFRLSIVPNEYNQILIPPYPLLAIHQKDAKYIVAECPKTSKGYLCDRENNFQSQTSEDCIQQLIITQQQEDKCQPVSIHLEKAALEQLDDRHYTTYFPNDTKIHLSCGQDTYKTLRGSYLVTLPYTCHMKTPDFTISNDEDRVKGNPIKIMNIPAEQRTVHPSSPTLKLNTIRLEHLHAENLKISQQQLISRTGGNNVLYHTTIPTYTIIMGAAVLISIIVYRRRKSHQDITQRPNADNIELQGVYAVPSERKEDIPAQFTTRLPIVADLRGEVLRKPPL